MRGIRRTLPARPIEADVRNIALPEILITGCRDFQRSADVFVDGDYHGALTHFLVKTIRTAGGAITYRDLHSQTKVQLEQRYGQVPQLEGRAKRLDCRFLSPVQ